MLRIKDKPPIPPNSIAHLRRRRGLTLEGLGEAIGTDASTVAKLEKSQMRLSDRWLPALSQALAATVDEIMRDPGSGPLPPKPPRSDVRKAEIHVPAIATLPNDLPVRGTAAGSHLSGAFQFEGGIVDYVRRPPALIGAMNAYGLYVEGVSMVPEHNPGDLRIVHPDRPPRIGDSVIVQIQIHENSGIESMIGKLIKRTEKAVFIGKLNPPATVELKRETVVAIHKVLTMNDLFGV